MGVFRKQPKKQWRKHQKLTKVLHALLVCLIQEEIALFNSTMHLKAQTQTGVLHQFRVDVLSQGLQGDNISTLVKRFP